MVALNPSTFMLIGGYDGDDRLSKTFYYQESHQDWSPGPEMDQARRKHAAGLGTDTETSEQYIVVAGGSGIYGSLDSVEILYSSGTKWQAGRQHFSMIKGNN